MSTLDEYLANDILLRVLIYGTPGTKKTLWALAAAEAGFRVLLFDADRGASIAKLLSPAARSRIHHIDCADGPLDSFAATFIALLLKEYCIYYNETTRRITTRPFADAQFIDLRNFGRETIVVLDSYTALVRSVTRQYAFENNIDLSTAAKEEWEGYRWCGALLSWILGQLAALPCHLIVVGHQTNYERHKKHPTDPRKQGPLEYVRRQLVSSSNPHGLTLARDFSDELYFITEGMTTYIDTRGNFLEEAKSRHVPPAKYLWSATHGYSEANMPGLSFADLAATVNALPETPAIPFNFALTPAAGSAAINPTSSASPTATLAPQVIKPGNAVGTLFTNALISKRR